MKTMSGSRVLKSIVLALAGAVAASTYAGTVAATAPAALAFAPLMPGSVATASGANAEFHRIDATWQGSTVLWDEQNKQFGSGDQIGTFGWGTGLWGLEDWRKTMAVAGGSTPPGAPTIVESWTGLVGDINYGNALYNAAYETQWGAASLAPIFEANDTPAEQENWVARFAGFIRIVEAGVYDFSVLNDDGFFLHLFGGNGQEVDSGRDYLNARDRNGLLEPLEMSAGLYAFELGAWTRLEAGVVDLRWSRDGGESWQLVPTEHLVPEPPAAALVLLGLGLALAGRRAGGRRGVGHAIKR